MEWVKEHARALRVRGKQVLGIEPRIRESIHPPMEYHGNADGGWNIVQNSLNGRSVVVDVGLGEDVTFSESIIGKYGCVVHGLDPTPRAIRFVKALDNPSLILHEFGIGATPGAAHFFLPNDESHVSGAVYMETHLGRSSIEVELRTIGQIFEMLHCKRIDVLKLDVEGAEYDVIGSPEFQRYAGAIDQLCVEFHHRFPARGKSSTEDAVRVLRKAGFECAWHCRSTNEEFLFVRRGLA